VKRGNSVVKIYRVTKHKGKGKGYEFIQVTNHSEGYRKPESFFDLKTAERRAGEIAQLLAGGTSRPPDSEPSYGRAIELLRETGVPSELAAGHFTRAFKILGDGRVIEAAEFFAQRNPDRLPTKTVAQVVAELLAQPGSAPGANATSQTCGTD
jgi:hypothetical protein